MKYNTIISSRLIGLTIHSGIQATLSYIFVAEWSLWFIPTVIFISHFIIDLIKICYGGEKLPTLLFDQLAHYVVIIGLWWLLRINGTITVSSNHLTFASWLIITSYIAILAPTSILIKSFIEYEKWIPSQSLPSEESLQGLPNAGKWIGYLERILILTFIYTGNIEGIGFLLAAKSVFRFGELNRTRDIKVTEYVLIGTLVSFTIAIVIGFGVKWLIG